MTYNPSEWDLRSLPATDVVVVGSGTAAVTAALECSKRGLSVRVLSDATHFSFDAAGRLDLWPTDLDRTDPLVAQIYPAGTVPRPRAMKHAAELALIGAGVPYLYTVRPIAVLVDELGAVSGLLVAARSAVFVVRCGSVIDATQFGVVASLAQLKPALQRAVPASCQWTVLTDAALEPRWNGVMQPVGQPFELAVGKEKRALAAWSLTLPLPAVDTPAALGHLLRAEVVEPRVRLFAETLPLQASAIYSPGKLVSSVREISDAALQPMPGLFLANACLPLQSDDLHRTDLQASLGRRAGAAVQRRSPGTDLHSVDAAGVTAHEQDRVDAVFLRDANQNIRLKKPAFSKLGQVDVLIAGGGTAGAPAGIAAARVGARTIVLESQAGLGGVGTLGLISCYWFGNRVGFTQELDQLVEQTDDQRQHKARWNPHLKMALYHRLLRDAGGQAWTQSFAFGARKHADRVTGLLVSTPCGAGVIEAGCVIDATGNADVVAAADGPTRWIGADHVACQGTGLSPLNPAVDYQNSDHTFIDDSDPQGVTHALTHSRAKFPREFDVSPLIDSRERRQIIGDVEVSPLDILAQRTFPDTIVTAMSNFDTHGFTVHPVFFVLPPDEKPLMAHVPFRAMLPQGVDGVIVTGLGASAHRDALPVIRMQADVQNQGFAAGWAAAESARRKCPVRSLDVRALQRRLVEVGILDPAVATHADSFPLPQELINAALEAGPTNFKSAAILIAHFEQVRPSLIQQLRSTDLAVAENAALVLGLMGDGAGLEILIAQLSRQGWDQGWNYRGMGQFGMSSSRLDAVALALGRIGDPRATKVIAQKIEQLEMDSSFSHCRCSAVAAASLRQPELSRALRHVLGLPGITGHAHLRTEQVMAQANEDTCETASRNASLREIYLARGLYLCGDLEGVGQTILRTYSNDLRGHFARHARAILATPAHANHRMQLA